MIHFNRFTAILALAAMISTVAPPLQARTRKGDKLMSEGRPLELRKEWDAALEKYEQALSTDPADPQYRMAVDRTRFYASQGHVDTGTTLRSQGRLPEALVEFQKAWAINPASSVAEQEIRRTQEMIRREQDREKAGTANPEERPLTPAQLEKKRVNDRIASMLPVPELKPLNPQPINIKMNNQPPRLLFETVGKVAGINVLFDPEYATTKNQNLELNNATLDEALDYVALITKSFWKPLSANTIFITNDNVTKRRDYEEQVMKVFYLSNVTTPQELQEIVTAVRSVADIQRLFVYNSQNAIIARGEADKIALADKIISDLDKPRSEVVIDVIVMSTTTGVTRNINASVTPQGLSVPITYNPRQSIRAGITNSGTTSGSGTTATPTTSTAIPLSNINKWATNDYAVTLPNGLLEAVLNDRSTKVLQSPQVRAVDNQKATLKIGDRQPTATGSFQPGIGGVGINPLVNTQFTFIDVGVNVDITPKVADNSEVYMHVELEISSVRDHVNLGGIDQPVISQQKAVHDIRLKDGQVNLLAGLNQSQESKTVVGIPGLSSIPLLGRLFSSHTLDKSQQELLIAIIPHIVRRPDINEQNIRGVAVGNATVVKLNYAARKPAEPAKPGTQPAQPGTQPAAPAGAQPPAPGPGLVTTPAPGTPAPQPAAPATPPAGPPAPPAPATPAATAPTPPAGTAKVSFVPAQVETTIGGTVNISLVLENATDLAAAPMQIKFDPKLLRMNDVVKGDLMGADPRQVVFTKNILNDAGTATINLNRMPGAGGTSGSGTLVNLSFQALERGVATVQVPQFTPRNTQGQPILTASPLVSVTIR